MGVLECRRQMSPTCREEKKQTKAVGTSIDNLPQQKASDVGFSLNAKELTSEYHTEDIPVHPSLQKSR